MARNKSRTVWSSDQGDVRKQESDQQKEKSLPPDE